MDNLFDTVLHSTVRVALEVNKQPIFHVETGYVLAVCSYYEAKNIPIKIESEYPLWKVTVLG